MHYSPWGHKESEMTEQQKLPYYIYITLANFYIDIENIWASQVVLVVKNLPTNEKDLRDTGLIPGWGKSSGGGNGHALQYSCLENPMDRGACQAIVQRVAKSCT